MFFILLYFCVLVLLVRLMRSTKESATLLIMWNRMSLKYRTSNQGFRVVIRVTSSNTVNSLVNFHNV